MVRSSLIAGLVLLGAAAACDESTEPQRATLALAFAGLEPLANGFHYEGWAITAAGAISTGKFNIGTNGALVTTTGAPIANGEFVVNADLDAASAIVITIEPSGDTDVVPADTHILAGGLAGGSATLSVAAPQALGTRFGNASGRYILATPTDGANTNEKSGIWFLDPAAGPGPGLVLPTLPAGWRYEGWTVISGTPVTTGTFTSASGADAAAPFSGPQPGPPFPGEDYLRNAPSGLTFPTDLSGGMAVISVEPVPDDSPAPFTLKPLVGAIPANALDHTGYTMAANTASLPTGTAVVR